MSVDHYPCSKCYEIFSDCGPFVYCEDCGELLCSKCMDMLEIEGPMADEKKDMDQCPFCSKVLFTYLDVMVWALKKLDITRKQAEDHMRE